MSSPLCIYPIIECNDNGGGYFVYEFEVYKLNLTPSLLHILSAQHSIRV
jgi:hypothetical protein